jgi:hypothetical protein
MGRFSVKSAQIQKPLQALSKIGIAATEIIEAMRVDTNNSDNYLNEQKEN